MNKIKNIIKTACVMLMVVSNAVVSPMQGVGTPSTTAPVTSMDDLQLRLENKLNGDLRTNKAHYGHVGSKEDQETLARNAQFKPFCEHVKRLTFMLDNDCKLFTCDEHSIEFDSLKSLLLILRTVEEDIKKEEKPNKCLDKATVLKSSIMKCMNSIGDKHNKDELIQKIVQWVRDESRKADEEFNTMCGNVPETARALHDTLGIDKLFAEISKDIRDISDTPASFLTFLSKCIAAIEVEELAVERIFHMLTDMLAQNLPSLT